MTYFTYASLFSGIGGFEQALNSLGGECVFSSEIDKFANKSYEALYGHTTMGDIKKVHEKDVPDHDVLVGGFPCQAFSVAGKSLGFEDARGTLFFEIARIAKEKQPKVMLLENVKGLLSHQKGDTIRSLLHVLDDIGYRVDLGLLNSRNFGLAQNRERIFFMCIRKDLATAIPFRTQASSTSPVLKRLFNALQLDELHLLDIEWPEPLPPVTLSSVLDVITEEDAYLPSEHVENLLTHLKPHEQIPGLHAGELEQLDAFFGKGEYEVRSIMTPKKVTTRSNGRRFKLNDEPSFTLTCIDKHGVLFMTKDTAYIRLLTVDEMFRLQGFAPQSVDVLRNAGLSTHQLHKQIGNAVSVPVIQAVAKTLISYL